ncbi:hypothetical protein GCM10010343_72570 [Streptomyces avidinii]|nr:hypothetical protein GCM10010343_72570 [Streptomyces avidinii]
MGGGHGQDGLLEVEEKDSGAKGPEPEIEMRPGHACTGVPALGGECRRGHGAVVMWHASVPRWHRADASIKGR